MLIKREFSFHTQSFFYLIFLVAQFLAQECDKTKCPGPLMFYDEIKCKPIYKKEGDCCAWKYDCSHLEERFKSHKCFVNDNVYNIQEKLKKEDSLPCSHDCICLENIPNRALFHCPVFDCFQTPPKEGCYLDHAPDECCPGKEICPTDPVTCLVDGKTYKEGDYFVPKDHPHTSCYCKPGYKGEYIEPFCFTRKSCGNELTNDFEIRAKCSPIYHYQKSPQTTCNMFFRCPLDTDTIIPSSDNQGKTSDDGSDTCTFGKLKMQIGDELNEAPDDFQNCVKCKCEVPPIPTCQRTSEKQCGESA